MSWHVQLINLLQRALRRTVQEEVTWRVSDYITYRGKLNENPLRVFISYDWNDKPKVRELHEKLKAQQYVKAWRDEEGLQGVEDWERTLWEVLREAECVAICLSRNSIRNRRYFKKKEIPFILEKAGGNTELSAYILIVKLEACNIPRRYGKRDVAEVHTEGGYEKLVELIEKNVQELRLKRGVQYKPRTHLSKFFG